MSVDIIFKIAGVGIITAVINNILERAKKKSPRLLRLRAGNSIAYGDRNDRRIV